MLHCGLRCYLPQVWRSCRKRVKTRGEIHETVFNVPFSSSVMLPFRILNFDSLAWFCEGWDQEVLVFPFSSGHPGIDWGVSLAKSAFHFKILKSTSASSSCAFEHSEPGLMMAMTSALPVLNIMCR